MSQHRCDETKPIHIPLTPQSLVLSIDENKTPNLSNGKNSVLNLGEDKEADAKTLITPHIVSTSSAHVEAACSKSRLKIWTSLIAGFHFLLVFKDEQLSASDISHCSSLSSFVPRISSASFTLYTPWNPSRPTFSINYQSSPYTSIPLPFHIYFLQILKYLCTSAPARLRKSRPCFSWDWRRSLTLRIPLVCPHYH